MSAVLRVLDLGAQLTDLLKSSTMTTARSSVAMAMPTAFTKGSRALKKQSILKRGERTLVLQEREQLVLAACQM